MRKPVHDLVEVRGSPVHGRGCFGRTRIGKGVRILEYVGERVTKAEANRRGLEQEARARRHGGAAVYIFQLNKRYDIDGNVPENLARFVNHSCRPNCEAVNIRGHIWFIALRDIAPGEELSIDYGYALEHFLDHPCRCGSRGCPGYIVHKDERLKLRRLLRRRERAAAAGEGIRSDCAGG